MNKKKKKKKKKKKGGKKSERGNVPSKQKPTQTRKKPQNVNGGNQYTKDKNKILKFMEEILNHEYAKHFITGARVYTATKNSPAVVRRQNYMDLSMIHNKIKSDAYGFVKLDLIMDGVFEDANSIWWNATENTCNITVYGCNFAALRKQARTLEDFFCKKVVADFGFAIVNDSDSESE